jgi:rhomboid protease GluP
MVSSLSGFLVSSVAGYVLRDYPWPVSGGRWTMGASASVFGLIGAVLYYGRRAGSSPAREQAKQWIVSGLLFGFLLQGIDNWAHLGGLAGGYLASMWLDPLQEERGNHAVLAIVALALSLGSVILSLLVPLPGFLLD